METVISLQQAIILGIVQGITEFLPISSSGHLILFPYLFGWDLQSLTFDVALHLGTLLAVIISFRSRWLNILRNITYLKILLVGTLPAVILGLLLGESIETIFRNPYVVAVNLISVSFIMYFAQKLSKKSLKDTDLKTKDGLFIGVFQALALFPGVSRSGITMSAGLFKNLTPKSAAEFSFILGTPAILGANVLKLIEMSQTGVDQLDMFLVGIITSTIVGVLTIKTFLTFLEKHSWFPFIVYRLILGIAIIIIITI